MNCPTELELSMYADGALQADETAHIESHVRFCAACQERVAALGVERRALQLALRTDDDAVPIPAFRGPVRRAVPVGPTAAVIALASSSLLLAHLLAGVRLPAPLAWLNPITPSAVIDAVLDFFLIIATEGRTMLASAIDTAGAVVLVALLISAAFVLAKRRGGIAIVFSLALAAVALSSPAQALEIRRSEGVLTVPAAETVDDTLIALGERVEIDGTVTGDLIAFGRQVVIRGDVQGQVVTGARMVDIEGNVGGSVLGFAETLTVMESEVTRNLFGFARDLTLRERASVGGNAVLFGSRAVLAGPVQTDVVGFAGELEIGSTVGGDVTGYAGQVRITSPARIGGNVVAHVGSEDDLQVSPGATIGGTVRTEIEEDLERREDEFRPVGFLTSQAVRFGAAFVTGLIVLWLVPSLRRMGVDGAGETVTAAAIGLVALVAVPIIALMTAITLIGLPIALLAFFLWLLGIYFAKILLAHFVGRALFERTGSERHFALALVVGLLLVFIVINVPFVGGLVNFLLTITGLGMLVIYLWGRFQGRPFAEAA